MKAAAKELVIDASIAVAWCFDDEKTPYTELVLNRMAEGVEASVPAVWSFETANALLMAERRRRLTTSQSSFFLDQLSNFNIRIDNAIAPHIFGAVMSEARRWHLTVYDASYLELALRRNLPLATLDETMKKAAKILGISMAFGSAGKSLS